MTGLPGDRLLRVLAALLAGWLFGAPGVGAQQAVDVRVDCREGIGLIPALWRGIATDGRMPEGVEVKTVRLGPQLVQRAWDGKLSGEAFDWAALDAALDSATARGAEVILPLPVPPGTALEALWPELVHETAAHVAGRASQFEIWAGNGAPVGGDEHYLDYFERALWAIYRANPGARVGGPGAEWTSRSLELLVWGCSERSLPLGFLSWRADSVAVTGLRASVDTVQHLLARHALPERPRQVIGAWSVRPDSLVVPSIRSIQAILSVLDTDLAAICLDVRTDPASLDVLRALQRLGLVRVVTAIDPNPHGLDGIVSLDGEDVIGLFWQTSGQEGVTAEVAFSGMAYGARARVRRYLISESIPADEAVETQVLRLQEPLRVVLPVVPDALTIVSVTVE